MWLSPVAVPILEVSIGGTEVPRLTETPTCRCPDGVLACSGNIAIGNVVNQERVSHFQVKGAKHTVFLEVATFRLVALSDTDIADGQPRGLFQNQNYSCAGSSIP